jgi:hypothetical protein
VTPGGGLKGDAYSDGGYGFDPATYYQVQHGLTISGTYFGVAEGVANGDTGAWGADGTDGPAFLGTDTGVSNLLTFQFDSAKEEVRLDVGVGNGDSDTFTVSSFLAGSPVGSEVLFITDDLNGSGTWATATLTGLFDEVRVTPTTGAAFGVDDVQYVPEPSTVLGLLMGSGLLSRLARRRQDRARQPPPRI